MQFKGIRHILLPLAMTVAAASFSIPAMASPDPTLIVAAGATAAAKKKTTKKKSTAKKKTTKKKTSKQKKSTSKKKTTSSKKKRTSATRKRTATVRKASPAPVEEQPQNDSLTLLVNEAVLAAVPENLNPGGLRVNAVRTDAAKRSATLQLNPNFTYLPVTHELIETLGKAARESLPDSISGYRVGLNVGTKPLSYYIMHIDRLPETARAPQPFVVELDPLDHPSKGMWGDIVALWHSHGRYYKTASGAWQWQRPLLFQSMEDTYTMGYILPYTVPMLENAGAYVLLPRERDVNRNEVIVDNDGEEGTVFSQLGYSETEGARSWKTGDGEGFIYDLKEFRDTENPFENGTYRQAETVREGTSPSTANWFADIPEDGEYAVYVSYQTLPESATDAHYTVNYAGGSKEFTVNQKMGGSTWVYLGTFPFEEGLDSDTPTVSLSNVSGRAGAVVTADAVKIGGGMGNIARSPRRADVYWGQDMPPEETAAPIPDTADATDNAECVDSDGTPDNEPQSAQTPAPAPARASGPAPDFKTSGLPRYLEGARYWLQWAGIPDEVYSPYHGTDDYKDDYTARGHWVNYLAGGSRVLPDAEGLGIPIDVCMALHSDAGKRADDTYVGTLGIYYTNGGDRYADGTPRINSRFLTDLLMRQITGDIRQTYDRDWTRRSMWDKSYVEARVPEVPTALIELLSHQNFADMRLGLDPGFRFTVGRAIYKALARFVAERKGREVVIQPLPVKDFAITRTKPGHYRLEWRPTDDPLEPTAKPDRYIIMERSEGEMSWHKIGETHSTHFDVRTDDNELHSLRVIAANNGGLAFPGETLAFREGEGDATPVLIVNGFTRISGPETVNEGDRAGFRSDVDFGVPYIRDISYTGPQTEFRRSAGESFGRSSGNDIDRIVAGNTFDFAAVHGQSVAASGRGFVSASLGALLDGEIKLSDYPAVDLILGKQRITTVGRDTTVRYEAFPPELRERLERYVDKGGRLLVSGAYVASDLFSPRASGGGADFARNVLGVIPDSTYVYRDGNLRSVAAPGGLGTHEYTYSNTLNEHQYIVENPDLLIPAPGADATLLMTVGDKGAGYLTRHGKGRVAVLSIPLESLTEEEQRDLLMSELLNALTDK